MSFLDPRDPRTVARTALSQCDKYSSDYRRLSGLVTQMAAELALMQGQEVTPQRGCQITEMCLGDSVVLVEYEYTPGEAPNFDVESPTCGPGCGHAVDLLQVFINGAWTDPRDILAERVLESWEEEIIGRCEEDAADRLYAARARHAEESL